MMINDGFAMEDITAKELLDLFLYFLDCRKSVLQKFTHYDNSTIAKDTFKKKIGAEKVFTCIAKRNIAEIIFCAIDMKEYGKNLKVKKDYFKNNGSNENHDKDGKAKNDGSKGKSQENHNKDGKAKKDDSKPKYLKKSLNPSVSFADQGKYTLNLLKFLKLLCGSNFEHEMFLELLMAYQEKVIRPKLDELDNQLNEIFEMIPEKYTVPTNDNLGGEIENLRQLLSDNKINDIINLKISPELERFRNWILNDPSKNKVLNSLRGKDIKDLAEDIAEQNQEEYEKVSKELFELISGLTCDEKARRLFNRILSKDKKDIETMRSNKSFKPILDLAIKGNLCEVRKVIVEVAKAKVKNINEKRNRIDDCYIKLFIYIFYLNFLKEIDDECRFSEVARDLFKKIMCSSEFYDKIYKKRYNMAYECREKLDFNDALSSMIDGIDTKIGLSDEHGYHTATRNRSQIELQESGPCYVMGMGSVEKNNLQFFLLPNSPDPKMSETEKIKLWLDHICIIISNGYRRGLLDDFLEEISEIISAFYAPFPEEYKDRGDSDLSSMQKLFSSLISNEVLSIEYYPDKINDAVDSIMKELKNSDTVIPNHLDRWKIT